MTQIIPTSSPEIALVRFSALGDVTLVTPVVRRLLSHFPDARITWLTSPSSYALLQGLPGINFEVINKPRSLSDYRAIYRRFSQRRFDAVLALQANFRINLLYPSLHAPVKIGFDRIRAREGQWLFCNHAIPFSNSHLLDSFFAFASELGVPPRPVVWNLPITQEDTDWAKAQISALRRPLIAVNPCSSKSERTWPLDRYQSVIRSAIQNWNAGIVITGGNSAQETTFCHMLYEAAPQHCLNLCGKTTPKQLAALLGLVDVLLAPDTGPVHIATAMGTPVVGLYAVASPVLTGPYHNQEFIVDRYPDAVRKFLKRDPDLVPWNTRVHHPWAMSLISIDDVLQQLERALERGHD